MKKKVIMGLDHFANSNLFMEDHGGEENLKKEIDFIFSTRDKYPEGWAREDFTPSNSKELANFYNASVYEGLEQGQNLEMASKNAL